MIPYNCNDLLINSTKPLVIHLLAQDFSVAANCAVNVLHRCVSIGSFCTWSLLSLVMMLLYEYRLAIVKIPVSVYRRAYHC